MAMAMAMAMAIFFLLLTVWELPFLLPGASALALQHPSHKAEDREGRIRLANSDSELRRKPPTCFELDCPAYGVIHSGEGYEIRKYNASTWVSTAPPIVDISFVSATRDGFLRLFDYIEGSNAEQRKIAMTAPVLTTIAPSSGPVCASAFTVRFFFSESSHEDPPTPEPKLKLKAEKWSSKCFAVRTFSGFASDGNVPEEAYKLLRSLAGSPWADITKRQADTQSQTYIIAQYNSPFEFSGRVNEVWFNIDTTRADCQLKLSQQ